MSSRGRERLLSPLMLGVASGSILVPLNSTMLAVALPGVMDEFSLGADAVSSLVSLYLGAVAVALPVSGSLGDRFGHRRLFLAGVVVFALASLLAVGAGSFLLLQVARVLQAVSGAFVSTSSAALIREAAPASRRGEAFGLFDLLVSTSAAAGPFIGGLLVGAFGWRSLFVIAVPVALVAAATVGIWLRPAAGVDPPSPHGQRRALDPVGLTLLAVVIVAILVALRPPAPWVAGLAALAIVPLSIVFVRVELRTAHPAVDPRLFASRPFSAAVAGVFGNTVVLHGCFLVVPLLVERSLGESATTSGLVLLGISGVAALVAPFGGRLSDRRGRRLPVIAGSLVTAAGLAFLALPAGVGSVVAIGLLLGLVGLGMGLSGSARQAAAFEAIPPERAGMAAGTYYTGRYLGGVVGASVAGATLAAGITPGGVSSAFAILAGVMLVAAVASRGLPGTRPGPSGPPHQAPGDEADGAIE
jgi:EmrB/QacA subfamily drug resistance transporter